MLFISVKLLLLQIGFLVCISYLLYRLKDAPVGAGFALALVADNAYPKLMELLL